MGGFGIDRHARSRKGRGLFRKAPDPREIGERLGRLARRMLKDAVARSGWKQDRFIVDIVLPPAVSPVTLSVEPSAEIVVRGDTGSLGPGYHAELIARLDPLLEELEYSWTDGFDPARCATEMYEWFAGELRAGGDATQLTLGVPATRRFAIDAPVLTLLGPRDAQWKAAVIADPLRAHDVFAWRERGPGKSELACALVAMWLEVPWREPLDKDERDLMQRVDDDLRAARKADASLAVPWAAWKELLANLGIDDEEVSQHAGTERATIGYRRHDLDVDLSGGWRVRLPGAMVGHWENEGERYWATDGDRVVEFASLTAPDETDSVRLLAVAPEVHPVIATLADGTRVGRAEAFRNEDVDIVIGLVAEAPHVGILTVKGGDREWALATWRSLHLAG